MLAAENEGCLEMEGFKLEPFIQESQTDAGWRCVEMVDAAEGRAEVEAKRQKAETALIDPEILDALVGRCSCKDWVSGGQDHCGRCWAERQIEKIDALSRERDTGRAEGRAAGLRSAAEQDEQAAGTREPTNPRARAKYLALRLSAVNHRAAAERVDGGGA
jgi:hypothetical protein